MTVLKAMFGFNGIHLPIAFREHFPSLSSVWFGNLPFTDSLTTLGVSLTLGLLLVWFAKNSLEIMEQKKRTVTMAIFVALLLFYSVTQLQNVSEFLYFNF